MQIKGQTTQWLKDKQQNERQHMAKGKTTIYKTLHRKLTPLKKPIQLILHASITDKHYNLLFIKLTLNQHDF